MNFCVADFEVEFLNCGAKFTRTMGLKRSYRVVAVFPFDFLGRLRSFLVFQIELISFPTTKSFWVVCFGFRMVVHGREKIGKTLKDRLRLKKMLWEPGFRQEEMF